MAMTCTTGPDGPIGGRDGGPVGLEPADLGHEADVVQVRHHGD
jgi:hypothetical protein